MKPFISTVLFISLLSLAATAFAQPYMGLNVGASIPSDSRLSDNDTSGTMSHNTGVALSGVAGLDFGISRIELEIGYRNNDVDRYSAGGTSTILSGSINMLNYMANGYLVAPFFFPVKPFAMAGLGLATMYAGELKLGGIRLNDSATNTQFAYQAGLGVTYDVAGWIALDAGYRYLGTSDFDLNGTKTEYGSHNLMLGCRYYF